MPTATDLHQAGRLAEARAACQAPLAAAPADHARLACVVADQPERAGYRLDPSLALLRTGGAEAAEAGLARAASLRPGWAIAVVPDALAGLAGARG